MLACTRGTTRGQCVSGSVHGFRARGSAPVGPRWQGAIKHRQTGALSLSLARARSLSLSLSRARTPHGNATGVACCPIFAHAQPKRVPVHTAHTSAHTRLDEGWREEVPARVDQHAAEGEPRPVPHRLRHDRAAGPTWAMNRGCAGWVAAGGGGRAPRTTHRDRVASELQHVPPQLAGTSHAPAACSMQHAARGTYGCGPASPCCTGGCSSWANVSRPRSAP